MYANASSAQTEATATVTSWSSARGRGRSRPPCLRDGPDDHADRQPEADGAVLEQGPERVLEPVDQHRDRDGHGRAGHQPGDAGDAERHEGADEHQRGEAALDQAQRAVADRDHLERTGQEVDRPHPVLREHVHQHRVARQDLVGRAQEEVLVELDEREVERRRWATRGERKEVGDGEEDQHHQHEVDGVAQPPRDGREPGPLVHEEHAHDTEGADEQDSEGDGLEVGEGQGHPGEQDAGDDPYRESVPGLRSSRRRHGRAEAARASTATATAPQIAAPTARTAGPPPQEASAVTRVTTTTRARPALSAPTTTERQPALGPAEIRSETRAASRTPAGISTAKATM